MNGKTLLLVSPYFPPHTGGVEQYVDNLAQLLHQRHGWRVVVVTHTQEPAYPTRFVDIEYARIYRIPFKMRISNTPIGVHSSRFLRDIIQREQIDVINAHAPVPLLADVAARCSGELPFVLTYHTGPMRNGRALYDLTCSIYERYVLSATARRADQIICSSDYVAESFHNLFGGKATTISPGVDTNLFQEGGRRDPNLVLFVGSLEKSAHYKGLPDLITAVSILHKDRPEVRLEVIGDGDGVADHIALCQQLGSAEIVTFAGRLDRVPLAAAYQRASVLALPTYYDSFPTVLVEALSTGRPVVSTAVGGIPTLVSNGVDGVLLTPGDISALASTIGNLLEDQALATEMGRRGAEKVRSALSWNTQADRTSGVLEKALSLRTPCLNSSLTGWRTTLPKVFNRCVALGAVSPVSKSYETGRAVLLPLGVDVKAFSPTPDLQHTSPTVLYVGRIDRSSGWKGLDVLFQSMPLLRSEVPGVHLNMVGTGDAVPQLQSFARRLGIDDIVRWKGALHGEALVEEYRRAGVVVLPSTTECESFGMVLIEAMACGRPVVGSNVGGIPFVIRPKIDGLLVPPGEPKALADACRSILLDPELAENLGAQGRSIAEERWDWSKRLVPMIDVLDRASLNPRKRRSAGRMYRGVGRR